MKRTATGALPVPDIDPTQGRLQISWSYADLHSTGTSALARTDGDAACPSMKHGKLVAFRVSTAVLFRVQFYWDLTLCR